MTTQSRGSHSLEYMLGTYIQCKNLPTMLNSWQDWYVQIQVWKTSAMVYVSENKGIKNTRMHQTGTNHSLIFLYCFSILYIINFSNQNLYHLLPSAFFRFGILCFCSVLRWKSRILIWDLNFLIQVFTAEHFLLSTALAASHKF